MRVYQRNPYLFLPSSCCTAGMSPIRRRRPPKKITKICAAHDTGYGNFNTQRRLEQQSSHLCAAHDTGHGNYNTQRRLEQQLPDDSTDNCQNDYERDDQLGPSNYRPVPPLAMGSYCQDDVYNAWEAYYPYSSSVPDIIPQTDPVPYLSMDEEIHDFPPGLHKLDMSVYNAWEAYYPYSSSVPDIIPQTDPVPYLSMDEEIHDFPPGLHKLDMSMVSDVDELLRRTQWQGGIEYPTPDEAYSAPPPTQLSLGSGPIPPDGTTVVKNVDSNNITIESTSSSYNTHTNVTNIYIESGRPKKKKVLKPKRGKAKSTRMQCILGKSRINDR